MNKSLIVFFSLLLIFSVTSLLADNPKVLLKTTKGDIVIELYPDKAPITVKNFLNYVDDKFYDGTIFHRVIKGFMIQGGGLTPDLKAKPEKRSPIKNEANNGLKNLRGTIAMARTSEIDSATCQFFINLVDNPFLDHVPNDPSKFGYAVFGKVIKGMEVVDAIADVPTTTKGMFRDVPAESVVIISATRL
ncbi:MAG: peptidylprolyl isomerase [Acidobacteriota bacterium]|nr:peptidylprolyl isomerase [Acidobacteriota bacterium]MDW3228839.1 peptidylprolyl isomerase [Acidobacteriota bacterium]MDY0231067.1 peptidylprolyl isomerase [Candidatus Saccharicenans sp.]